VKHGPTIMRFRGHVKDGLAAVYINVSTGTGFSAFIKWHKANGLWLKVKRERGLKIPFAISL
jgi:hypothetical protein